MGPSLVEHVHEHPMGLRGCTCNCAGLNLLDQSDELGMTMSFHLRIPEGPSLGKPVMEPYFRHD